MRHVGNRRAWWAGLGWKLLAAFGVVIAVGVVTLWVAMASTAPSIFDLHMADMMRGGGMGQMMGRGRASSAASESMDAALADLFRESMTQALLLATAASVLAAVAVSAFVTGRVVGPVRRLATASRRLAAGHYAERVPIQADDELGDLATSFNEMAAALETTERRRRELIGDVAHELRTPIATLRGYLEGLLDGVVEADARTWAKLHDEAGRLQRLVDDLQELSRVEARQVPLKVQPVEPAAIVRAALDRVDGLLADGGFELTTRVPTGLPAVRADPDRAIQVLTNLLTNALRYTPGHGRVEVSVDRMDAAVQFRVRDSGIGIAADELPHVFERFYRVDRSRSRSAGGSGIGLTIAQALVEGMGGRIWAESPGQGQGATFGFTLPAA